MIQWLLMGSIAVDIVSITAVLWCMVDAMVDMQTVVRAGLHNGRRMVASADLRAQTIRLAQVLTLGAMVFLVLPIVARSNREPDEITVTVFLMFTVVHVLLGVNAVMDLAHRRAMARAKKG